MGILHYHLRQATTEFKHSRTSLADDERSKRPKIVTIVDKIEKAHHMVPDDLRINNRGCGYIERMCLSYVDCKIAQASDC